MKNKIIKNLITSFVLFAVLFFAKFVVAATSYSYETSNGMIVYVDDGIIDNDYREYDNRYDDYNYDRYDRYREKEDYLYYNDEKYQNNTPIVNTQPVRNIEPSTNSNYQGNTNSGTTINNYYSLFSSFGSKTDKDSSSTENDKVAVSNGSDTKDKTLSKDTSTVSNENIDEDKYYRYGGAVDVTNSNLGASAGDSGFVPHTFWGWLIVIVLLLIAIILVRIIIKSKDSKKENI